MWGREGKIEENRVLRSKAQYRIWMFSLLCPLSPPFQPYSGSNIPVVSRLREEYKREGEIRRGIRRGIRRWKEGRGEEGK